MLDFLSLKTEAFGLDISDLSLKIAKLKKRGRFLNLTVFGKKEMGQGIVKEGEIIRQDELVKIIKEAVKEIGGKKLRTKYVVASLPEEKSFFQVIQMPKMPEEDLMSAVIYEAENYIPVPIERAYLDFQTIDPIKGHLDHLDVLITAIPKDTVDPYLSSLKAAGLEPKALEIESLAISRALIKDGITTSPILLIDFGATKTSFIIFSGRSLRFTSSISVSSMNFTEIISKSLGVGPEKAEKLKIKYGLEEKIKLKTKNSDKSKSKKERSEIFESLVPALVDLTQQIKKHLSYYQSHTSHEHLPQGNESVSKILLCGGGANLKGLPELLESELKIPVEIGNPWINILPKDKKEIKNLSFEESQAYTTALGLSLREINESYDEL